jgi:sugar/nucleoside kinase (ribokinase family)
MVFKILNKTDILIYNKEEAELLFGKLEMKDLLFKSASIGPKVVVITDGKNGCVLLEKTKESEKFYSLKPRKVKVVETTGAGDAFASSFLSGYIKSGGDIKFALKMGMVNAESVIQYVGAKEKLLRYNEALKSMNKNPHKIFMGIGLK